MKTKDAKYPEHGSKINDLVCRLIMGYQGDEGCCFYPTSDTNAAHAVECKIDRLSLYRGKVVPHVQAEGGGTAVYGRSMRQDYVVALLEMKKLEPGGYEITTGPLNNRIGYRFSVDELWAMIHATPFERCKAALIAAGVEEFEP